MGTMLEDFRAINEQLALERQLSGLASRVEADYLLEDVKEKFLKLMKITRADLEGLDNETTMQSSIFTVGELRQVLDD